jgi:CheY-like chemotaxis protein
MGNIERRLIEAMIQIKLSIAELYSIFSEAAPEDYFFWAELAREKSSHVTLLKSGRNIIMPAAEIPSGIASEDLQSLMDTKNWLFSLIAKFSIDPPDRATTFETALLIEKSMSESHTRYAMGSRSHSESIIQFDLQGEAYISTLDWLRGYLAKLKSLNELPAIVGEYILIVKDEKGVAGLLQEILKQLLGADKHFDTVESGKAGMDKIIEKYYKLIISDIELPGMDGIELYNQASKLFPNINKRFMFVSGDLSPDKLSFFKEFNIEYMDLPASVQDISTRAQKVLLS